MSLTNTRPRSRWQVRLTFPRFDGHLHYGHHGRGGEHDEATEAAVVRNNIPSASAVLSGARIAS